MIGISIPKAIGNRETESGLSAYFFLFLDRAELSILAISYNNFDLQLNQAYLKVIKAQAFLT